MMINDEDKITIGNLQVLSPIKREKVLAEMKALAQQIAAAWTSPKSGVELIAEQRR